MSSRLVDLHPVGTPVEVLFRSAGLASSTPETWVPGTVIRHAHPGVWVETPRGGRWFVTNGNRIRRPVGAALATVFKILGRDDWDLVRRVGSWTGSPDDVRDGFIHLSSAAQVRGTATKHFAGRADLILLDIDPFRLARGTLRWEPSRSGTLYPHLHAPLLPIHVTRARPIPIAPEGHHTFPPDLPM